MTAIFIRCKECGESFDNFGAYRRHLLTRHTKVEGIGWLMEADHKEIVDYIQRNPQIIEPGMRIIARELPLLRGRADLVGRDRQGRLCLIDVTRSKYLKRKKEQLKRYRGYLRSLGSRLFNVSAKEVIRLIIFEPGKEPLEVE